MPAVAQRRRKHAIDRHGQRLWRRHRSQPGRVPGHLQRRFRQEQEQQQQYGAREMAGEAEQHGHAISKGK
jgi:hypothetical protein